MQNLDPVQVFFLGVLFGGLVAPLVAAILVAIAAFLDEQGQDEQGLRLH